MWSHLYSLAIQCENLSEYRETAPNVRITVKVLQWLNDEQHQSAFYHQHQVCSHQHCPTLCPFPAAKVELWCFSGCSCIHVSVMFYQQLHYLHMSQHLCTASLSANPSHRSLSFSSSGLTTWIPPDCLLLLLSISVFSFSVLHSLTHVGFRTHVEIASRIVS